MKMTRMSPFALLGLSILAWAGCSRVTAPAPLGSESVDLTPSIHGWEGTWLARHGKGQSFDELFEISQVEPGRGVLQITWLETERGPVGCQTAQLWVRSSGDCLFVSMRLNDSPVAPQFLFARVEKQDNQLIFWAPNAARFKRLIVANNLPGKISDNGHALLGDLAQEHLQLISGEAKDRLFHQHNPSIWIKASDRLYLTALQEGDWAAAAEMHAQMIALWPGSKTLQKEKFEPRLARAHDPSSGLENLPPLLSQR